MDVVRPASVPTDSAFAVSGIAVLNAFGLGGSLKSFKILSNSSKANLASSHI
jgi:hypothetical protein